jgi:hypothetical protein
MEPVTSPNSWQPVSGAASADSAATSRARNAKAGRQDNRGIGAPKTDGTAFYEGPSRTLPQAAPFRFGERFAAYEFCDLPAAPGAPRHDASISSSERPRVSGTATITQMSPITQKAANSQNV